MHARSNPALAAILLCGAAASAQQQLFTNGPLATGAASQSGVLAPPGSVWSEIANDSGQTTIANASAGFAVRGASRIADDFTNLSDWYVSYIVVPVVEPAATIPTVSAATLQIWNGPPNAGGTVIFGDTTTNRLAQVQLSSIVRCFNTIVPPTCGGVAPPPTLLFRVQSVQIAVNAALPPGTYWIDYNVAGASFAPMTTQLGTRQPGGAAASNALLLNGTWSPIADPGQGCNPTPVTQSAAFELYGFIPCYPNCDSSTVAPCLNANDFLCFLNRFAAGDSYANCDLSSLPPVLNVNDFTCFLGRFGVGCPNNNNCAPSP